MSALQPAGVSRNLGVRPNLNRRAIQIKKRTDSLDMVRGMALAEAAAADKDKDVRSEIKEDSDEERLKLRLFVGERSTFVTLDNFDVDHVWGDSAARDRIQKKIRAALAHL